MADQMISVAVPVYNEEQVVNEFYKRMSAVLEKLTANYEIVFVNDGSRDKTLAILEELAQKDKKVKVVNFSRNYGHQIALTAALDHVSGDAVLMIDSDLQDPPEVLPEMLQKWREGYQVVYGKRKKRPGETLFKLMTAKYFYRFINKMSDMEFPTDTGDFRLVDKKVIQAIRLLPEKNRYLRGLFTWVGFSQYALEYDRQERHAGTTKYPLRKMLKFATDAITSFSVKPLQIALNIGLFTMFIAFLILAWSIGVKIFNPTQVVHGWTSLIGSIVFLGGVQLFTIGIIGEYVGRIYEEVKRRPLYIVERTMNIGDNK